jgi:hypothetical protein
MNTAVLIAIIAASVSIVGWLVNHVLSLRSERRRIRLVAQLSHIEKQLAELYGPLAFLLYEGTGSFEDLLGTLGRRYIFTGDSALPEGELKLWLFWVDYDLMPRNAVIQSLLSTKTHLIAGSDMPASYVKFLDHYNSWRVSHARWKEHGVEYSWHSKINWPQEFESEVIDTFKDLMRRHAELIGAVARV